MEKIQFKRANTISGLPTLSVGEIGVVQSRTPKDNYIVFGTDYGNKALTAYPYYSGSTGGVVYDVTIQDSDVGTEKNLVVKKVTLYGTKTETPISFTISGTIEKAKQLVNDSGNGYSVGSNTSSACQPIYFTSGKPSAITQTRGSANTPVYLDKGVIKPITSYSGQIITDKDATFDGNVYINNDIYSWIRLKNKTVSSSGYNWGDPPSGVYAIQMTYGNDTWRRTVVLVYDADQRDVRQSSSCCDPRTETYMYMRNGILHILQGLSETNGYIYSIRKIG